MTTSSPLTLLLLGGSGFIGRAVLRELARQPHGSLRIRALLRQPDTLPAQAGLERISGSLEQWPTTLEPDAPYVLVHLAVKQIDRDGGGYLATNVTATEALLARLGPRLRGVLYASSMSVYGQGVQDGIDERAAPRPDTPLAHSRLRAERVIAARARAAGVPTLAMRPRFVIGAGDRHVLPAFARVTRHPLQIGNGHQRFSFIDVDDYARVIVRLATRLVEQYENGDSSQSSVHIGYRQPLDFARIAAIIREIDPSRRPPLARLPVAPTLTRWLRRLPSAGLAQLATRLELLGLSHWGSTERLATLAGADLVERDPAAVFQHAVRKLIRGDG
ncbi:MULTISPECIES: NAD(P)-dependent oxidoreductase [unclassified Burkholderia]|uniref:NAD-dependent epimerase/dehydratase family protein n=1 Tax=unclassified Burkholderia TaxID=2613784 RepID=UPI001422871D|nr:MULTISPECIES: NAD(P)-dependent oxidoreductase [unclassified Burkholderia]NIE82524.1 NAD(P)-dependent oxidoreductase [Burkholderia sp. Tr-860]NIF61301.1 NAD(P)-dependent oxidoreductase [Burkholderia sp. Cy-647]NIF94506.1 NAD(P)-dependent oxidoreductase [Burkholderia sp. Ax-1720]